MFGCDLNHGQGLIMYCTCALYGAFCTSYLDPYLLTRNMKQTIQITHNTRSSSNWPTIATPWYSSIQSNYVTIHWLRKYPSFLPLTFHYSFFLQCRSSKLAPKPCGQSCCTVMTSLLPCAWWPKFDRFLAGRDGQCGVCINAFRIGV